MACMAVWKSYDRAGDPVGSGTVYLPESLDWMPIEVKAHWFRYMGQGPASSAFVLLSSQGEQKLLQQVTLRPLDATSYKEKKSGSEDEIQNFIEKGGYSRVPRNQ